MGNKTKLVSSGRFNGDAPSVGGKKAPPAQFVKMHHLDKPIVQSGPKLGSNKFNKGSK